MLAHEKGAFQIDITGLVPRLLVAAQHVPEKRICPGIVDQDVQTRIKAFDLPEQGLNLLHDACMAGNRLRLASGSDDFLLDAAEVLQFPAGQDHLGAVSRQRLYDRLSDSAACAGDQRRFPMQIEEIHYFLPCCSCGTSVGSDRAFFCSPFLMNTSGSPPLMPARCLTNFLRDSMSYWVVIAICSMIGEPPPW